MSAKVTSIIIVLLVLVPAACGGHRPTVPVRDDTIASRQPESEYRNVLHGDTLYSIAWESGQDYHDLAAWNYLPAPYTIVPGQRLRLYPPKSNVRLQTAPPPSTAQMQKPAIPGRSAGVRPLQASAGTNARTPQVQPKKPSKSAPRPKATVQRPKPLPPAVRIQPTASPPRPTVPKENTGERPSADFACPATFLCGILRQH